MMVMFWGLKCLGEWGSDKCLCPLGSRNEGSFVTVKLDPLIFGWGTFIMVHRGGTCPGGIHAGGVPTRGVYLPRGMYMPRGVYMPRGCTCLGGTYLGGMYLSGGYLPRYYPCGQNDRHV